MKKQTNLRKRFFVCTCTAIFVLLLSSGGAYAEESVCEPNSIEINTASKEDLKLLPGVGPTIAERIIEGRPFGSVDDLISVSGIGQKRLQDIKEQGCAWVNVELLEEDEEEVVEEGQEELEEEEQENQEEEGVGESEEEGEGIQDDESDDANEDEDSEEAGGSGGNGSGGSGGSDPAPVVDINVVLVKAVAFLQNQELSPDIVMAFIAVGQSADISFLKTFFGDSAISYAKPILAITATGQDPRTFPEEDFVEKLKSFTDDTQLGDPSLLNDDIWGILALRSAGVPASDPVIQNSKAFLLQDQNADGGWAWDAGGTSDTNDTAAAIMALLETGMTETDNAIQLARQYLKELGIEKTGLDKLILAGYKLLDLVTFLTSGEPETRAWTVKRGTKGPEAAGVIHTDFIKGYIKADVCDWQDFVQFGGWSGIKTSGKLRLEGKEYEVRDGDVCYFHIAT